MHFSQNECEHGKMDSDWLSMQMQHSSVSHVAPPVCGSKLIVNEQLRCRLNRCDCELLNYESTEYILGHKYRRSELVAGRHVFNISQRRSLLDLVVHVNVLLQI